MQPAPPIARLQHLGRARAGLPGAAGARGVADEVRELLIPAPGSEPALLAELSPEPVGAEQGRVCRARGHGRRQACGAREFEELGRAGEGRWGQGWVEGVSGSCAEVAGRHGCRWDRESGEGYNERFDGRGVQIKHERQWCDQGRLMHWRARIRGMLADQVWSKREQERVRARARGDEGSVIYCILDVPLKQAA